MPLANFTRDLRTAAVASTVTAGLFLLSGAVAGPRDLKVTGLTVVDDQGSPIARLGVEDVVFADGRREESIGLFLIPGMFTASVMTFYYNRGPESLLNDEHPDRVYVPHPMARSPLGRSIVQDMIESGRAESAEDVLAQAYASLLAPLHPHPPKGQGETLPTTPTDRAPIDPGTP